ncbi:MAG: hypothetical protein KAG98_01990 [Lentisphaeria bacterium]|nr:hypothetical protein [Lentisphaeria bacterium]
MKKKIFSIMVIMFLSGGLLGFFVGKSSYTQRRPKPRTHTRGEGKKQQQKRISRHFTTSLKLSKVQQKELDKLISNILRGKKELEIKNKPKQIKLLKSFNTGLRKILNDDQKKKFNKMQQTRESKLFPGKPMQGRGLHRNRKKASK